MFRLSRVLRYSTAAARVSPSARVCIAHPIRIPQTGAAFHTSVVRLLPQSLDSDAKLVSFDEVSDHLKKKNVVFVDVREPEEFQEGHIPGALNIPFRSSPGALGLEDAEFEETFGFKKPTKDANLVFYCQGGVRSSGAEQLAATYGYQNRENYKGSFADYTENKGEVEK